jgi:hypothetical protein
VSRASSISAARAVAQSLARPAPGFLHSIALVKSSGVLTQQVPLSMDSPFGALPDAASSGGSVAPPEPAGRIGAPKIVRNLAERPPVAERRDANITPLPVFSLRRGARAAKPEHAAPTAPPPARPFTIATLEAVRPPDTRLPAAPRAEASPAPSPGAVRLAAAMTNHPETPTRPRETTREAMELLDSIATELLAAPAAAPRGAAAASPAPPPPARESEPRQAIVPSHRKPGRDFPALAHDAGRPGTTNLELPLIDSAASAQVSLVPRPAAVTSFSLAVASQTSSSPTATGDAQPASPQLDPELLASLVNEVLVEQARRHGVDLS